MKLYEITLTFFFRFSPMKTSLASAAEIFFSWIMSELLKGYNRNERESIARSILLRAYSDSLRHPNIHRRVALDVVMASDKRLRNRTAHFSKTNKSIRTKKKMMNTNKINETRKSIFSLLNNISTRAQTPLRRKRGSPSRHSRPRTQGSKRTLRSKTPALSRPNTSHYTSTKRDNGKKIRTRSRSKCFLGAGFKTKKKLPTGKLKPLASVEPLTAWGSSCDSPHFPRIFP